MIIPEAKKSMVNGTANLVKEYEKQYSDGLLTYQEKYNKVVDAWSQCTDQVTDAMMGEMAKGVGVDMNSVFMMADSGARGSTAQMKQLAAMRGLMAKPSGEIIETPIISNFKEGLSVLEYFNSTHGARKGLADTALKTANSGYLTRRLVDVAQDVIITEDDCGTTNGIIKTTIIEGSDVIESIGEQILGRVASDNIIDPTNSNVLVKAGSLIMESDVVAIENAEIDSVKVRSVLTCNTENGVCAACYGRDLARGTIVNKGEAVGVIAAQSIGEPGTQLTMRTFHIGGAAQQTEQSSIESAIEGTLKLVKGNIIKDSNGSEVVMSRDAEIVVLDANKRERSKNKVPKGARLLFKDGSKIMKGDKLVEWDPYTRPIISEKSGIIKYSDLLEGVSIQEDMNDETGISSKRVKDWRSNSQLTKSNSKMKDFNPRIEIVNKAGKMLKISSGANASYELPVDAILSVENGQEVFAGDLIARIPLEFKLRDITGGLPRVAELFEARRPKEHAFISEIDGKVQSGKDYKGKRRLEIVSDNGDIQEYLIPKGRHITVQEGDEVRKGDTLTDGPRVPHDILTAMGVEALASYLVDEVQEVYRLQGVKINDKHIEVITRQMMQKVEIIDPGDTTFLVGEQIAIKEFHAENNNLAKNSTKAISKPVLQGITKASLSTSSFISAASFQETTRVLTEAAVGGKSDQLMGLKENVIVGRLIPAGTGRTLEGYRSIAHSKDQEIIKMREETELKISEENKPADEAI
jgi:DNA-directed RNA polymerase subunit beta'